MSRDLLRGNTKGLDYDSGSGRQSLRRRGVWGTGGNGVRRVVAEAFSSSPYPSHRCLRAAVVDSPRVHIEMPQASPSATVPQRGGLVGQKGQTGSLPIAWDGVSSGTILVAHVEGNIGEHQDFQTQEFNAA